MSAISLDRVTKRFGTHTAVNNLSLEVPDGSIYGFIGPNGSGKTTLINTLTGIVPLDGGIVVLGAKVPIAPTRLSRIVPSDVATCGMTRTFQSVRLVPQMTVLDNILVVLTKRSVWGALFERHTAFHLDAAHDILKKVGLWDKRDALAENLSYGQRKLLEIARAVSMDAKIYFFDEPYAGLFTEMRKIVSGILRELRDTGAAVVLVEHDMALVRELADLVYVLDSGKVIAHGTPEYVLKQEHVIEAYLGK